MGSWFVAVRFAALGRLGRVSPAGSRPESPRDGGPSAAAAAACTGRLVGQLARRDTRRNPGYLGITHPDWWDLQLRLREQADRALFWRRNVKEFQALAVGGLFFHLANDQTGREDLRAVRGFSVYPGMYEVDTPESLWRRYGELLGVARIGQLYDRLQVEPGRLLGVIHLEGVTELERSVTLEELRANGFTSRATSSAVGVWLSTKARPSLSSAGWGWNKRRTQLPTLHRGTAPWKAEDELTLLPVPPGAAAPRRAAPQPAEGSATSTPWGRSSASSTIGGRRCAGDVAGWIELATRRDDLPGEIVGEQQSAEAL